MPSKAVCKLQVSPPITSHLVSLKDCLACTVEAQLVVAQRKHADDLRERQGAAANGNHVHPCFVTSTSYPFERKTMEDDADQWVQRVMTTCVLPNIFPRFKAKTFKP